MSLKFDNEKLANYVGKIQEKYKIETVEDYQKLATEEPVKVQGLLVEAGSALINSMVGKSFEELSMDDMQELQGAGDDIGAETSVVCFLGSLAVGGAISIVKC